MTIRTESPEKRDVEYFTFMQQVFNVTAILDDLAAGKLKPTLSAFDADFIESFATRLSNLKKDEPFATGISILTGVRAVDVHAIPAEAYEKPLILAYAGKNKGLLNIDGTGPHYLLVDGNKRLGKAFFEGRPKPRCRHPQPDTIAQVQRALTPCPASCRAFFLR